MSLIKNSLYNIMYQLITILIPIITLPYVSRVLGAGGVGIQAYTNAIAQYFLILGVVGLDIYSSRQIAYVRDDKDKLNNTFLELITLRAITTSIAFFVYILAFVVFNDKNKFIYLIQSLNILASMIDVSWFFIGIEEIKKNVIRNSIVKITGVIFIFIFVKEAEDVTNYILILSATQFLGQFTIWAFIPKYIKLNSIKLKNIRRHLGPSIKLFIPQLAAQVYLLLDKIMLGFFVCESEVGLYDNSQKIVRIAMTILTSIGVVMIPRMSNLFANGKIDKFKENVYDVFSFMNFLSIPMAFGLCGIVFDFKPWFYGDGFNGVEILIIINSFIIIFGAWCNICGFQILIPMKKEKEFTYSVLVGTFINLILNILLISSLKSIGTSIASVIAELAVPLVQIYFIKNFINIKKLFSGTFKYFISGVIMMIAILLVSLLLKPCIITTGVEITIGILIYSTIMILLKDKNIIFAKTCFLKFIKK